MAPAATDRVRLVGPDVVRAVALIGVVVMNYHAFLINDGGEISDNLWGTLLPSERMVHWQLASLRPSC